MYLKSVVFKCCGSFCSVNAQAGYQHLYTKFSFDTKWKLKPFLQKPNSFFLDLKRTTSHFFPSLKNIQVPIWSVKQVFLAVIIPLCSSSAFSGSDGKQNPHPSFCANIYSKSFSEADMKLLPSKSVKSLNVTDFLVELRQLIDWLIISHFSSTNTNIWWFRLLRCEDLLFIWYDS